ncbi:hypothetical protein N7532_005937 [Penicillium argentinense]|uniref:C2H2-type domain-containing protein n=1 Tax=Penicillium argentinense TaxID=1131581 RepID=A0A9W9FF19_9EURO|nr:uncharacterized protein N7532_005937 [Penicillium argentinense]KAJ5098936.1 hypothetical protein N7532_005937 [Penicillium argentinense]
MPGGRTSIVSILNNDDHPSFAVRSNSRHTSSQPSPPLYSQPEQLPPPVSNSQYPHPHASSESPTASPRGNRHPFSPISEAVQPTSPGSSEGSAYDYLTSHASSSAYHPYSRQEPRRDAYRYPSRGPAAPRTSPEIQSNPGTEVKSPGGSRGTGKKNKYPCPYAASHGCAATFTTSGHAARHGKKHTGEKSVLCPICNKAFTRKDNMKQHIRTHRTHSDDMRSTSEPEAESRWGMMARPESSSYASAHNRTISQVSQSTASDASVIPPGTQ